MYTERFLLGRGRDKLDSVELGALEAAMSGVQRVVARKLMVRRGDRVRHSLLVVEGLVCRYMDDREGARQIVAMHVAGEFVDLHGFPMGRLDHDVAALTPVTVATFEHAALEGLIRAHPHLGRMLWFSTLLDAAMHREWIFRLGRLDAAGRVAHLFCELDAKMAMAGLTGGDGRFALPITQADLAESCGITPVHVNRVLRSLRETGLLLFRDGMAEIQDRARLRALGEFDPAYLYGDGSSLAHD